MDSFFTKIESFAVKALTKRKAKRLYMKAQPKTVLSEIWSWIDALIFAVFWVIIINQYLFQLFVIPSPSMVSTLNVQDRVIVNKDAYGIELYPAGKKIHTEAGRVQRDHIITFYNPEYETRGPVFDVLSQVVYMGTLSLVNIDTDEDGSPRERLYVKRAAGMGGDTIRFSEGNVQIRLSGEPSFVKENDFRAAAGLSLGPNRTVDGSLYDGLRAAGRLTAYQESNLMGYAPEYLKKAYQSIAGTDYDYKFDLYEFEKARTGIIHQFDFSSMKARSDASLYENGIYVPEGYVLPLGDNRDNSYDGRYFGPVDESRINGRVIGRFWPLGKAGSLIGK